jgi:hypothetical protein
MSLPPPETPVGQASAVLASLDPVRSGNAHDVAQITAPLNLQTSPYRLYVFFCSLQRIRFINGATDVITTLAGTGTAGFATGNPTTAAQLLSPTAVVTAGVSVIPFITDTGNQLVRKVDVVGGDVPIVAGLNPTSPPAATAPLAQSVLFGPTAVATGGGNVYIAGAQSRAWVQQRGKPCKDTAVLVHEHGLPAKACTSLAICRSTLMLRVPPARHPISHIKRIVRMIYCHQHCAAFDQAPDLPHAGSSAAFKYMQQTYTQGSYCPVN